MLKFLNEKCQGSRLTLQAVVTKVDKIPPGGTHILKMRRRICDVAPICLPALITSADMKPPLGIENMRKSIAEACNLI